MYVKGERLMKTKRIVIAVTAILFLTITALNAGAQTVKQYEDMSRAERLGFVGEQARRIAREISGSEYEFTTDFEQDIQRFVTHYAQRIGKSRNERGHAARTKCRADGECCVQVAQRLTAGWALPRVD
jgi:hypothetical protein